MTDDPIPEDTTDDNSLFKLFAGVGLQLSTIAQQLTKFNDKQQQRLSQIPNFVTVERQSTNITGTDIQDFGTPPPGRKWVVRLFNAVTPAFAANASIAALYVGPLLPVPVSSNCRWFFPSCPNVKNFTSDSITVLPNQHVYVQITGAPAATTIAYALGFDDLPMSSERSSIMVG